MHDVIFQPLRLDRQKSSRTDMKRHRHAPGAFGVQFRQKLRRKMQACRRRSNCPLASGIDSLILRLIASRIPLASLDIGRQRRFAVKMKKPEHIGIRRRKTDQHFAALALFQNFCGKIRSEYNRIANAQPFSGPRKSQPRSRILLFMQEDLGFHSAPMPVKPGRDHLRIVEDQKIICAQQVRQIVDMTIRQSRSSHMQKPRRVTRHKRRLGDPGFRKIEIEIFRQPFGNKYA